MMSSEVWALFPGEYDDYSLVGVFSSAEAAKAAGEVRREAPIVWERGPEPFEYHEVDPPPHAGSMLIERFTVDRVT